MLERAFAPHDPRYVHEHMTSEEAAAVLAKLKPQFIIRSARSSFRRSCASTVSISISSISTCCVCAAYPSDSLTSDIAYAFHHIEDACQAHGRTNGPRRGVQLLPWQEFGGVR
jgi:hypothetical protein